MVTDDPSEPTEWKLSVAEKKDLLGDALIEVGGRGPKGSNEEVQRRLPTDLEPVSFHGSGLAFSTDIIRNFCLGKIVDATPLNENMALAAIILKKKHVGICAHDDARLLNKLVKFGRHLCPLAPRVPLEEELVAYERWRFVERLQRGRGG